MIQLRPYQNDLILQIRAQFKKGKRMVIMCLPTGGGKTVVFSSMVKQALEKDLFGRVLILTDRKELLTQAGGTLEKFGMQAEYITAKSKYTNKHARLFVGMVETVERRKEKLSWLFHQIKLVIIDEAHKGNFRKVLPLFENAFIIGATATPLSASKKHPLKDYFEGIAEGPQIPELVNDGYLCPAKTYTVEEDLSDLKTSSTGDYTGQSLNAHYNQHERRLGVVKQYREKANNTKALVFCVGVEHAEKTAMEFREQGYNARTVDGKTPKHIRETTLLWFKNTPSAILCNCGVLTTGFDEPSIETIIVNRATKSLPLWLQMCGRGSRLSPGKERFTILDMGANVISGGHFLWEHERDWKTLFLNPSKTKETDEIGAASYKECPDCESIVLAQVRKCECGYKFPQEEKKLEESNLVEVDSKIGKVPEHLRKPKNEMTITELIERAKYGSNNLGRSYKTGWILHEVKKRGEKALHEYAKIKGYKSGWVKMQMGI